MKVLLLLLSFIIGGLASPPNDNTIVEAIQNMQQSIGNLGRALVTKDAAAQKEIATLKLQNTAAQKEIATLKLQDAAAQKEIDALISQDAVAQKEIDALKSQDAAAQKEIDALKSQDAAAQKEIDALISQVKKIESEAVRLDENKKIAHSVLPAGFSEVRVADLQLESLHVAAAAACRGSTATGGSGYYGNTVYPRSTGHSCKQVCKSTGYVNCDAEVSVVGHSRLARTSKDIVGFFYNYGCDDSNPYANFETNIKPSDRINMYGYISYCCCRK